MTKIDCWPDKNGSRVPGHKPRVCVGGMIADLFEVGELVLVGCGDGDKFRSGFEVLGDASRVPSVLVESAEQWHLVVHVRQLNAEPHVDMKRICCSVLHSGNITTYLFTYMFIY